MQRETHSNPYVVKVGDTVTYEYDNEIQTHTILEQKMAWKPIGWGSRYATQFHEFIDLTNSDLSKGTMNEKAPIAQSLLGKKIGESFTVTIDNETFYGKILGINSYTTMKDDVHSKVAISKTDDVPPNDVISMTDIIFPKEEIRKTLYRLSYTSYFSGLYFGDLREFKIVIHREKGVAVRLKGGNETEYGIKIIDIEPICKEKLQSIFEQLDKIQFPMQRSFNINGVDGETWRLLIDDVEYSGHFVRPKFLQEILSIINYNNLYEKYNKAFELYFGSKK